MNKFNLTLYFSLLLIAIGLAIVTLWMVIRRPFLRVRMEVALHTLFRAVSIFCIYIVDSLNSKIILSSKFLNRNI